MRRAVFRVLVGCAMLSPPGAFAKFDVKEVVSGEAAAGIRVGHEDENVKPRVATFEANLGEGPGGCSPWNADLPTRCPRPARVIDAKVLGEGGIVRLDRLAVRER
jgi:hypothetical protein